MIINLLNRYLELYELPQPMLMNILIIEDNPIYQIKLRNIVEQIGHQVLCIIGTVEEARIYIKLTEQYDLIISDVVLQDGNVFEINQWSSDIPIIFITAMEDVDYLKNSLAIKNSWFLIKPFSELTIQAAIIKLLGSFFKPENLYITVFGKYKNPINIPLNEVLFLKSEGNYSTIVTNNHIKYAVKRSAKLLVNEGIENFVRIRRATFINKSKITKVSIPDSRVYVGDYSFVFTKEFKKNMYEYC